MPWLLRIAMQTKKWFERTFGFPVPPEMLPNIEARLRGTPARLEDLFRGRPSGVLTRKPEAKWSAQEHAGHLLDLESLWLARVEDFAAGRDRLTPADLSNRKTDEAHHNAGPVSEILAGFRQARQSLLQRVEDLGAADSNAIPHPRMGTPMRLLDHLFFVAEHDDHHLAEIGRLLRHSI